MSRSTLGLAVFILALAGCQCGDPSVQCRDQADCMDPQRSFCGRPGLPGVCVECVQDTDCPSWQCLPDGVCAQCGPGRHCGIGEMCTDGACTPGCANDTDNCPEGLYCVAGQPVCSECLVDAHCPSGKICSPAHSCVPGCSAAHPCPAGQQCDLATSQCVQCVNDSHCSGATPRCQLSTHTCVPCLPGPGDNCPQGQYCRADLQCERGCKVNADCPSGVCLPNHSCQDCTADSQCAAGNICSSGTCVPGCGIANPCGNGLTCCNQHCVNQQNDSANCGACGLGCGNGTTCCGGGCKPLDTVANCGTCGNSCGANQGCCAGSCTAINSLQNCGACGVVCGVDQFCDGTACVNQTFPNFCKNKQVYALYDGIAADDAATNILVSTIQQYCSASTVISYGPQTNPQWVDQTTGAILLGGGTTVVTAGGPFPNKPVKWLEKTSQVTKVYFHTNGIDTYSFKKRSDDSVVSTMPSSQCLTPGKDQFVIELATDPQSGALALLTYGVCSGTGTKASAYFWANVALANLSAYPDSWYIFEWVDTNADSTPNAGDTFTKLASGI